MKNKVRRSSFLHFAVLCCFILGSYNTAVLTADLGSFTGTHRYGDNFISVASSNLFLPFSKNENKVYGSDNSSPSSEKDTSSEFSFCSKEAEIALFSSCLQHIDFFKKVVLPFHSTDIVFPFHYFW